MIITFCCCNTLLRRQTFHDKIGWFTLYDCYHEVAIISREKRWWNRKVTLLLWHPVENPREGKVRRTKRKRQKRKNKVDRKKRRRAFRLLEMRYQTVGEWSRDITSGGKTKYQPCSYTWIRRFERSLRFQFNFQARST